VNHFLLRLQWPGMPQKLVLDQIELLGAQVVSRQATAPPRPAAGA
jgi:hypothetical protein